MPLKRTQVRKGLDPLAYTVRTVPDLSAKGDPWEGYEAAAKPLKAAIGKLAKG